MLLGFPVNHRGEQNFTFIKGECDRTCYWCFGGKHSVHLNVRQRYFLKCCVLSMCSVRRSTDNQLLSEHMCQQHLGYQSIYYYKTLCTRIQDISLISTAVCWRESSRISTATFSRPPGRPELAENPDACPSRIQMTKEETPTLNTTQFLPWLS